MRRASSKERPAWSKELNPASMTSESKDSDAQEYGDGQDSPVQGRPSLTVDTDAPSDEDFDACLFERRGSENKRFSYPSVPGQRSDAALYALLVSSLLKGCLILYMFAALPTGWALTKGFCASTLVASAAMGMTFWRRHRLGPKDSSGFGLGLAAGVLDCLSWLFLLAVAWQPLPLPLSP